MALKIAKAGYRALASEHHPDRGGNKAVMQEDQFGVGMVPPSVSRRVVTLLEIAVAYLRRGWQPLPVIFKSKLPTIPAWPDFRADEHQLAEASLPTPR